MTTSRQLPRCKQILRRGQRGAFVIECVLVMGVMALLIGFTIDMVNVQNVHGRLQRLAYSGATLVRERNTLYDGRQELSIDDVDNLFRLLGQSLLRTHGLSRTHGEYSPDRLGLHVEQTVYQALSGNTSSVSYQQGIPCQPPRNIKEDHSLFPDRQDLTIYQVTLCHEADSFYQRLLGRSGIVRASMLMPGR